MGMNVGSVEAFVEDPDVKIDDFKLWEVTDGNCVVSGRFLTSPGYPTAYSAASSCKAKPVIAGYAVPIKVELDPQDSLKVGTTEFTATGPAYQEVTANTVVHFAVSSSNSAKPGFKIELTTGTIDDAEQETTRMSAASPLARPPASWLAWLFAAALL